jgi:uncharacterized protein YjcR
MRFFYTRKTVSVLPIPILLLSKTRGINKAGSAFVLAYDCAMIYAEPVKEAARKLYLQQVKPTEIAVQLNINIRSVYNWIRDYGWSDLVQQETPLQAMERRLILLAAREKKSDADYHEIEKLVTHIGQLKKMDDKYQRENSGSGEKKKKKKDAAKNEIGHLTQEEFDKYFKASMFGYQLLWREHGYDEEINRSRFYLKSRQIGATYYFSGEGFEKAVLTGKNQIFVSASKAQAEIFRGYIIAFARQWFDIELTGNPIKLAKDGKPWAELHFLSTNSNTSQGYHGDVYYDEVFWTPKWTKLHENSQPIAAQAKYCKTYFSTPSVKSHEAYPLWSGSHFSKTRKGKFNFDFSKDQLRDGIKGDDGIFRQIVSIEDAAAKGCKLFDIELLKLENTPDNYRNKFMCEFIDDSFGIFSFKDLLKGAVDASSWDDFDINAARPFGNREVWIGYDPARTRDNATVVVIAPPDLVSGGKLRLLEKITFSNKGFTYQANRIEELTKKYNVRHIGIDVTGVGMAVGESVRAFFAAVHTINYSLETKAALVQKAQDIISGHRFEYDAVHTDVAQSFMMIKQGITPNGQVTYKADRTEATGHADVAFAIMHAFIKEPLNSANRRRSRYAMKKAA